jgi:hypothetical protein
MDTAVDEEIIAQSAEKPPAVSAISGDFSALSEVNGIAVPNNERALALPIDGGKWIARINAVNRHDMPRRQRGIYSYDILYHVTTLIAGSVQRKAPEFPPGPPVKSELFGGTS